MPRLVPGPNFFRLVEYEGLPAQPVGVLERILAAELDGVIVRGVLSDAQVDGMLARLQARVADEPKVPISNDSHAFTLGQMLVTCTGGLDAYLDDTERTERMLDAVLEQPVGFRESALGWLRTLTQRFEVAGPQADEGRRFAIASVRCLPPGNELAAHCEGEQLQQPAYTHFGAQLVDHQLLSYFVALNDTLPRDPLVIYKLRVEGVLPHMSVDVKQKLRARIEQCERFAVPVRKGDLLVFHGARHYHRVLPTEGERARWTVGGFLALGRDQRILVWS